MLVIQEKFLGKKNLHFLSLRHVIKCLILFLGLELLKTAIANAGYTGKIKIGMDVAASEFCKDKVYDLDFKNPKSKKDDWVGKLFER